MIDKIRKKILISTAIAGLVYLGFTVYADFGLVADAFKNFNWFLLPILLFLSLINYLVRFSKWDYYIHLLKIGLKKIDSFSIFMSGLIMSVTPGKMGELLKSYLVKQVTGEPISKTAPIVLIERITDFVSLIFIGLVGAYVFDYGRTLVLAVTIFFIILLALLSNKKFALFSINFLKRTKILTKHLTKIQNAYESSYTLLRPLPLFYMTILSLISWSFECLGYHIILLNFNIDVGFLWASFSYAFATIAGAVTMLPGGLGVTEGSLTFLLINKGYSNEVAVASTFIIRAVTLWFAVLVGVFGVSFYQNRFGKITVDSVS